MSTNEEKKRYVYVLETDIYEKFKLLAKKENRSATNLVVTLIKKYVEEHSQNF